MFGQVPADSHVPGVAGLRRRGSLAVQSRLWGGAWGGVRSRAPQCGQEQRVAVVPGQHHARCGALPSQLLQGERRRPGDPKPGLLAQICCGLTRQPRTPLLPGLSMGDSEVPKNYPCHSHSFSMPECGRGDSGDGVRKEAHRGGEAQGRRT